VNYYNEFDPKAAAWLRELIAQGLIPAGDVDTRSITEVKPHDLAKYTQCHFFAGIGGWSLALQLAGWPATRPVWTGSCPCQPFSIGNVTDGGGLGFSDPRHLWPAFFNLIKECRPGVVLGEQVADAIRKGWLDLVKEDLEMEDYAFAPVVLPARAYGADHLRKRIFWVADSGSQGREGCQLIERIPCGEAASLPEHGYPLIRARRALAGNWSDLPAFDGVSIGMVRSVIKGAGNAIVPQVAAEFVSAFMEVQSA
jgi:DNA (cytosine-5)-methyltransferase 1